MSLFLLIFITIIFCGMTANLMLNLSLPSDFIAQHGQDSDWLFDKWFRALAGVPIAIFILFNVLGNDILANGITISEAMLFMVFCVCSSAILLKLLAQKIVNRRQQQRHARQRETSKNLKKSNNPFSHELNNSNNIELTKLSNSSNRFLNQVHQPANQTDKRQQPIPIKIATTELYQDNLLIKIFSIGEKKPVYIINAEGIFHRVKLVGQDSHYNPETGIRHFKWQDIHQIHKHAQPTTIDDIYRYELHLELKTGKMVRLPIMSMKRKVGARFIPMTVKETFRVFERGFQHAKMS